MKNGQASPKSIVHARTFEHNLKPLSLNEIFSSEKTQLFSLGLAIY